MNILFFAVWIGKFFYNHLYIEIYEINKLVVSLCIYCAIIFCDNELLLPGISLGMTSWACKVDSYLHQQ